MLPDIPMTLKELYTELEPEVEKAWGQEVERRLAELESGKVQAIPGEEVMARMRKIVGL